MQSNMNYQTIQPPKNTKSGYTSVYSPSNCCVDEALQNMRPMNPNPYMDGNIFQTQPNGWNAGMKPPIYNNGTSTISTSPIVDPFSTFNSSSSSSSSSYAIKPTSNGQMSALEERLKSKNSQHMDVNQPLYGLNDKQSNNGQREILFGVPPPAPNVGNMTTKNEQSIDIGFLEMPPSYLSSGDMKMKENTNTTMNTPNFFDVLDGPIIASNPTPSTSQNQKQNIKATSELKREEIKTQEYANAESSIEKELDETEYEVVFEHGRKLGVLMERVDVWEDGQSKRRESAVVKLVVENGAAYNAGVTVGSIILAINEKDVKNQTYNETLDMVKNAPRPMKLRFKRVEEPKDNTQGSILARVSGGTFSVGNLTSGNAKWNSHYYAFGGSKMDILQLFESRAAYHECVIALYEKRPLCSEVQSFRICADHRLSPVKSKLYKGYGNLHYFSLKVPSLHFIPAKFASDEYETIKNLWSKLNEIIEKQKQYDY